MGQRMNYSKHELDQTGLLLSIVKQHETTIAEMMQTQEPILRYAKAMRFLCEFTEYVDTEELQYAHGTDVFDIIEEGINTWELQRGREYNPKWSDV
jgi:hypothetical protein